MAQYKYPRDMSTAQKLMVSNKPMMKDSVATSDRILFGAYGRPNNHKDKPNIAHFRYAVSGHYSTDNVYNQ